MPAGQSELYREIPDELLVAGCVDAEHLRIARELRLHSAMVVPLATHSGVLGAITFVFRQLDRDRGGDVPAAALTAYARTEERRSMLNAGYSIHLPKPVEPAELVAAVSTLSRFIQRPQRPPES